MRLCHVSSRGHQTHCYKTQSSTPCHQAIDKCFCLEVRKVKTLVFVCNQLNAKLHAHTTNKNYFNLSNQVAKKHQSKMK